MGPTRVRVLAGASLNPGYCVTGCRDELCNSTCWNNELPDRSKWDTMNETQRKEVLSKVKICSDNCYQNTNAKYCYVPCCPPQTGGTAYCANTQECVEESQGMSEYAFSTCVGEKCAARRIRECEQSNSLFDDCLAVHDNRCHLAR